MKNLSIAIDSSLSYCSITVFKNKKIIWNREKKCEFGHEKYLANLLKKMITDLSVHPQDFSSLYLNKGPARFTCIRNCHALVKGFFINHSLNIYAFSIYEHFYLGLKNKKFNYVACLLDTNRRDILIQIMNNKGQVIGKPETHRIENILINKLNKYDYIMGNGTDKIIDLDNIDLIRKKIIYPKHLKTKFFVKNFYNKKPLKKIPRIIYPYSPV